MTRGSTSRLLPTLGVALLFTIIGVFLLRGSFVNFDYLGSKDWNAFMGQAQAEVSSLLRYDEFPLWNPWRRGGQVGFAQPESMFLTPVTPLALWLGVVAAFKLLLVPIYVFGCLGMWMLAGQLGLVGLARLAPALMFFSSAAYPYYVAGGLPNWLFGIAILPWLLWARRRGTTDHRFVLLGGIGYAGVIFAGSVYQFVFFPIIVGLDGLLESIQTKRWRPMLTAIAMLLLGSAISLVRVLPMYDVYRVYPRELAAEERYLTLPLVARAFLDPTQPDLTALSGTVFRDGTNWVSWVTVGCYVGPVFAALAVIGFLMRLKRTWPLFAIAIFLGWMSLGAGADWSLWNLLHGLPLLKSMQAPERLLVPAGFIASLGAGYGIEVLEQLFARVRALRNRVRSVVVALLSVATIVPLVVNDGVAYFAFLEEPNRELPAPGPFVQIVQQKRETQWGGELVEAVLSNRGNPFAQADVPSPHAVQSADAPGYQGEVWLTKGRGTIEFEVRARTIRVRADLADDDTLIVNQNYFPGWVASGTVNGPMVARQGLLSLSLPAGQHEIVIGFRQNSVIIGAVLSVLSLAIALAAILLRRQRDGQWFDVGLPELMSLGASALMLLALPIAALTDPATGSEPQMESRRKTALVVAANSDTPTNYRDIQQAIDDAVAGETILVKAGTYSGFRMRSGITVVAETSGSVHLANGGVEILDVPLGFPAQVVGIVFDDPKASITVRGCSANVILQGLVIPAQETAEGVAVHVEQSAPVHLLRCRTGAVHVRGGFLLASHGEIHAPERGEPIVALDVLNGRALLNEMSVRGANAPAMLGNRGRIEASSQDAQAFQGGPNGPLIRLTRGSWLRLSGIEVPDSSIERENDVRLDRFDPPLPTVRFTRPVSTSSEIEVEITGPKNGTGTLIVSPVVSLIELPGSRQLVQSNLGPGNFLIPIQLPESGVLTFNTMIQGTHLTVGWPIFLQFVAQVEGPKNGLIWKGVRVSMLDGACVEP